MGRNMPHKEGMNDATTPTTPVPTVPALEYQPNIRSSAKVRPANLVFVRETAPLWVYRQVTTGLPEVRISKKDGIQVGYASGEARGSSPYRAAK